MVFRNTLKAILFVIFGVTAGLFIGWFLADEGIEQNALTVDTAQAESLPVPNQNAPAQQVQSPAVQPVPAVPQAVSDNQSENTQTGDRTNVAKISRDDDEQRFIKYRDLFAEEKQKEINARISELADERANIEVQRRLETEDQRRSEERQAIALTVEKLLTAAEEAMSREAYHRPPGESALHYYREALLLDPTNQRAFDGIDAVSDSFIEKSEFFLSAGDYLAARAAADIALASQTNNTRAVKLLKNIDEQAAASEADTVPAKDSLLDELEELKSTLREHELIVDVERETEAAVNRVLSAGNLALKEGRLIEPEGDNAYDYFVRALSIDLNNGSARGGIEEVRSRLLRSGTQFVRAGNFGSARTRVKDLNKVDPSGVLATLLNQIIISNEQGPQIQTSNVAPDQVELVSRLRQAEERAADAELALRTVEQSTDTSDSKTNEDSSQLQLIEGIADYDSGRYDDAYGKLGRLADVNNIRASFQLALMQFYGRGVEVSKDAALATMVRVEPDVRRKADSGQAWAQFNVGLMYENGWVVQRDLDRAITWYRKSADQGYGAAFNNLGVLYEQGNGVQRDRAKSVAFLRRAARQGNAIARENLKQLGVLKVN